jgi:DNA-binding NarL/FixJ family response regulator
VFADLDRKANSKGENNMSNKEHGSWHACNRTFTEKHKEMMPYLAQGKSSRDIAQILNISMSCAISRIEKMMNIAGCLTREELIGYIRREQANESA